jgi:hypothetical protein
VSKKDPLWLRKYYIRIRSYGIPRRWGIFTANRHWEFPTFYHALRGLQQISDAGEKEFQKADSAEIKIEKIYGATPDFWSHIDERTYHPRIF